MARNGPKWTEDEDDAIREAAAMNREHGRYLVIDVEVCKAVFGAARVARLRELARELGRSYLAVRKRASRLEARSDRPHR